MARRSRRVLFATAELDPIVKVGGLGEACAGLVRALPYHAVDVDVVLPDYGDYELTGEERIDLDVPPWAAPAIARRGYLEGVASPVTLIDVPGIRRPHPYVDPTTGQDWPDNQYRFFAFCAAVTAVIRQDNPDVVHLNDWHTAAVAGMCGPAWPYVLTIHNLAFQGQCDRLWLDRLGVRSMPYLHRGEVNPLAGAVRLADRVVAVSPSYATEVCQPEFGAGLEDLMQAKGSALVGIRNGIDIDVWDPLEDLLLPAPFHRDDLDGKTICRKELLRMTPFETEVDEPVVGLVARFVHQKGIDIALAAAPYLSRIPARLVLVGEGDPELQRQADAMAARFPDRVWNAGCYNDELAHQVIAGSDMLLMPSRFEPCGLTQMQAMNCGTIPVVSGVGGLRDTVVDADVDTGGGRGFVADEASPVAIVDALHRATRTWRNKRRRSAIQRRGMAVDWSWGAPAAAYARIYQEV